MKHIIYPLALCALLAGCADMATSGGDDQGYEEKVLVTGSNIPRKKNPDDHAYSKEGAESAMRQMNLPASTASQPGGR